MSARRLHVLLASLSVISSLTLVSSSFVRAQSGGITKKVSVSFPKAPPTGPPAIVTGPVMPIKLSITDEKVTKVDILVSSIARPGLTYTLPLTRQQADRALPFEIHPYPGVNSIKLFAIRGEVADTKPSDEIRVQCDPPVCGADRKIPSPGETTDPPKEGQEGPAKSSGNIAISVPDATASKNAPTIEPLFKIKKGSGITKLWITVTKGDDLVERQVVEVAYFDDIGLAKPKLKLVDGKNLISAFDPRSPAENASIEVNCEGDKCGKAQSAETASGGAKKDAEISILKPTANEAANEGTLDAVLSVAKDSKVKRLDYEVLYTADGKAKRDAGKVVDVKAGVVIIPKIPVRSGENTIRFFDPDNPGKAETQASIKVTCADSKCAKAATKESADSEITIDEPTVKPNEAYPAKDISSLDAYLTVAKESAIRNIQYDVIHDGTVIYTSPSEAVTPGDQKRITLRFVRGNNTIRIYDVLHPGGENDAAIDIICTGENCASDLDVATIRTNSRFTRAIVGMEQAGGSSAESKVSPFLDFFFTTPIIFRPYKEFVEVTKLGPDGKPLRDANGKPITEWVRTSVGPDGKSLRRGFIGTWGEIRLSTTPQQTSSFAVLPSNFVNQLSDPTKAVELVQSFDFLAGLEVQAYPSNGWSWTLIPGIKQHTSLWITVGGGAISPLSAQRESAQLFVIPPDAITGPPAVPADPRRAEFIRRFGDPPTTAKYVGFVPLERDRFFRQYYGGIRLKTNYCDDPDCRTYKNNFPSILDVAVGQNEAVTGGAFKSEVRDSAGNLTGRRRNWVLRVDGFFPMPFREANFLYLYGTALMKIGGGGPKVQNPLFLDQPASTIQITDPAVYIPLPDFQPTRVDRDYFKIGIGVNLTDLFNRDKPRP